MSAVRLVGERRLDASFVWDGHRLWHEHDFEPGTEVPRGLRGGAAYVVAGARGWRLLRDPLGINKLFWVNDADRDILVAARPRWLVDEGHPFESVRAFPRGCVLDVLSNGDARQPGSIALADHPSRDADPNKRLEQISRRIRSTLDGYLAAIATARPSRRAFVCLSGGLDSSGIAALAREHFDEIVAVSFDVERSGKCHSEDRAVAERLARDMGIPLLHATCTERQLLEHLDVVLVEGIDWRDFNVHAGLVNAVLAQAIRAEGGEGALVLTGDLPNEFLIDYQPEHYRGVTYYRLPRLAPAALRSALVQGLETSHREVGVFGAFGLPVVQPYAVAVDSYLALPIDFLVREHRKQELCRAVIGQLVPEYVYARQKTRAQVGDVETGGGVLAVCVDHGIDAMVLRKRFAKLHGVTDLGELDRFIRAGRYRASLPGVAGRK